ncbi:MAG: 1-(5-phosphoribosyl)-5-[(5-phosphoribosylamino)methylideneamino]imidazole-4-carboxamide isomerase [Cytophagales bacterium]|nr:1-(5-phosphoribosyl)-5-[(5-phosphoribosylamino)methylideneamino]imidazole-4-carboxamide isomerase [Bernardetiaceae bacterium]MDW8203802.1 1-(5-phosphoribosyl)-5-[(5-phosphoribosylamino)methylideneamino]imidazole-4-carboxamide isomerase [Cytophagales bacterium]
MYLIPAIDLVDGKCVRLTQGDYQRMTVYHHNPVEVAKKFQDAGISRLHLVDLDGAKAKKVINLKVLEAIARQTALHIDFGGGVQSTEDLRRVFDAGAAQVTGGSIAVKNPELFMNWLQTYGSERIILGADARNGSIAVSGWQETTDLPLTDFIASYIAKGIRYVICTDVTRDGTLQGAARDVYASLLQQFPSLQLIASGGIGTIADVEALQPLNLYGVIIGKAFYEGRITWQDLKRYAC